MLYIPVLYAIIPRATAAALTVSNVELPGAGVIGTGEKAAGEAGLDGTASGVSGSIDVRTKALTGTATVRAGGLTRIGTRMFGGRMFGGGATTVMCAARGGGTLMGPRGGGGGMPNNPGEEPLFGFVVEASKYTASTSPVHASYKYKKRTAFLIRRPSSRRVS